MFNVVKRKTKEKITNLKVDEYVKNNKIPETSEYIVRNKIRERREELGLTQENVAEMLNITRQSLSLIENERQMPTLLISWLIARVLSSEVNELFYFEEIEEDYNEKTK